MEIKTCEQYVLAELERLKKELEDAYDRMFELDKELQEAMNQKEKLVEAIRDAKKALDVEISGSEEEELHIRVWNYSIGKDSRPERYTTIKSLFELVEPDNNDRTKEDTESNTQSNK